MVPLRVPLSLQIENLKLKQESFIEFDLSSILEPFDFNWFMLCPSAMSFFQKLFPAPFPPFHALFLSHIWAHNVASTIF